MDSSEQLKIRISEDDVREFQMVENFDWQQGVTLAELVEWINAVAERFQPEDLDRDARSSANFTARSFRHYQTLGCIDPPKRVGRSGHYGFRQYLQALLIRKLLWERVPAEHITRAMVNRSNDEYKQMLFDGIDIVPIATELAADSKAILAPKSEQWGRHLVAAGVELHLQEGRGNLSNEQRAAALTEIERLLRKNQ